MIKTKILTEKDLPILEETACSVGNFDGFHLGHQKIIKKLKEEAEKNSLKSMVITFDPHPKNVLGKHKICTITNWETRQAFLSKAGIDYMLILKFTPEFYKKDPEDFFLFLKEKLNCKVLVVGSDWKFGYKKSGDIEVAYKLGKKFGIKVISVSPEKENNEKISSSYIRKLLQEGKVEEVKKYLGRKYCIFGKVVRGTGKGKELGFPTINIKLPENMCLKRGVYAGYVIINGKSFPAAINFGIRPTIDGKKEFLEIHVIKGEIPEEIEYVKVIFEKFIREERKFPNLDELKKQISVDIQKILEVLETDEN